MKSKAISKNEEKKQQAPILNIQSEEKKDE
jgi:hypothetical protein